MAYLKSDLVRKSVPAPQGDLCGPNSALFPTRRNNKQIKWSEQMDLFKCPGPELVSVFNAAGSTPALGRCHRPSGLVGQSLLCSHTATCRSHMGQPRSRQPGPATCRSRCRDVIFILIFILPYLDVNRFGPGGVPCRLLSQPGCCRVKLGRRGLFLGLTSEPTLQPPPTRLGTADEKCPLSKVKIKRKQCCYCRLHFSLLPAM